MRKLHRSIKSDINRYAHSVDEQRHKSSDGRHHEQHRHPLDSPTHLLYIENEEYRKGGNHEHQGGVPGCQRVVADDVPDQEGEEDEQLPIDLEESVFVFVVLSVQLVLGPRVDALLDGALLVLVSWLIFFLIFYFEPVDEVISGFLSNCSSIRTEGFFLIAVFIFLGLEPRIFDFFVGSKNGEYKNGDEEEKVDGF